MFNNRLRAHFENTNSSNRLTADAHKPLSINSIPSIYLSQREIYQLARERARRDLELDRLFNPDFYEHGGGI